MKLNEFKAWFEGYTESMDAAPNKKQWERIKEQVSAIDGVAVSYPVYIDRYVRPYWHSYQNYLVGQAGGIGVGSSSSYGALSAAGQNSAAYTSAANSANAGQQFDGVTAMYAAGKAEALNS